MGLVNSEGDIIVEAKYKWIRPFKWPEVRYTIFQNGDSTGVIDTDGRIALAPQRVEPKIIGSFAVFYDVPEELLGLHVVDLDRSIEVLTDDSLRLWDVINTTPPILQALHMQKQRTYLFKANGNLITSCDHGLFQIVIPDKNCPIFRSSSDERGVYKRRYFDCHGIGISPEEFQLKYPHAEKYSVLEQEARHNSLMTILGNPKPHAKSFQKQEQIRVYRGTAPHPMAKSIQQKVPGVRILEIVETSETVGAIVFNGNDSIGVVNAQGDYLIPAVNSIIEVDDAWLKVQQGAKVGILSLNGTEILPIQFRSIECYFNLYEYSPYTFYVRTHSGYEGFATLEGQIFLPPAAFE